MAAALDDLAAVMALSGAARTALRYAGVTPQEWARANWSQDGRWHGDSCGCPDDRCAGHHHADGGECGCLPALLSEFLAGGGSFATFHAPCVQCAEPIVRCVAERCWCLGGGADPAVHASTGSHWCVPGSTVNLRVAEIRRRAAS